MLPEETPFLVRLQSCFGELPNHHTRSPRRQASAQKPPRSRRERSRIAQGGAQRTLGHHPPRGLVSRSAAPKPPHSHTSNPCPLWHQKERAGTLKVPALFLHQLPRGVQYLQDLVSLSRRLRVSTLSTTFSTSVRKKLLEGCTTATCVPVWPSAEAISFQR